MTSNNRRVIRAVCVVVCNALIVATSLYLIIGGHRRGVVFTVSALSVVACSVGILAELRGHKMAAPINIGIPALIMLFMASRFVWGPAIAHLSSPYYTAEQTEVDAFLLVFSGVPLSLTLLMVLVYRKFRDRA